MNNLSGFLELLKGPLKILSGNGKLMAITAILYLIFYSISFTFYTYSSNPLITDLVIIFRTLVMEHPDTPEYAKLLVALREEIGIFLGIKTIYVVLLFFIMILAQTAIVIISSSYYGGVNLSLKELLMKVSRTWTRPFVTSFYVQLLTLGYMSIFFWPLLVPSLLLFNHRTFLIILLVFLGILIITLYLYLSVVWGLAVVVSVVEDSYGISALGKARELVKGKMVHGFLLNLFFVLGFMVIGGNKYVFTWILSIYQFMAYSVFYFQCNTKMKPSEGLEYSEIPSAPILNEDIP
ncbi:hypothetical protein OSB04_014987 [Centaurea solstitialis]|uniref:Uncharacterized protein n=1 Tax=Centaurea solstitialis TaxID=347529 RepID=A0AA38W6Z7_9ASTR|nr:hypothetical protein OSB04_014987 [Centaurea solstitialis]